MTQPVVLITGAARGIGYATAEVFLNHGFDVAVCDIVEPKVSLPVGMNFYKLDVTDEQQVMAVVNEIVVEDYGRLDVLVNNAGRTIDKPILKMTEWDFMAVIDVNLKGPFLMTKHCAPHLMKNDIHEGGSIVNVTSCNAHGCYSQANYAASKAGLKALTLTTALEFSKKGIRANAVAPGYSDTDMVAAVSKEVLDKNVIPQIMLGRLGRPEEIAKSIYYLAVDGTFIQGSELSINGGMKLLA